MNIPMCSRFSRLLLLSVVISATVLCHRLPAQTNSPAQVLAKMDQCREQVISQLSFSDKMKMKAAMGAIQSNPQFIAANKAVTTAPNPEAQVEARRALAKVKLDLIAQQDPSLKPVVEKIRVAQASVLK